MKCHCGSTASLKSNSLLYNGKEYGNGRAYICDRFPACRGSVGTHTGSKKPLGTIVDDDTKKLRMAVHAKIDPLWKRGITSRNQLYRNLDRIVGYTYHTGEADAETCRKILALNIEEIINPLHV